MHDKIACTQEQLIEKLRKLHFHGPLLFAGHQFMLYNGQALVLPDGEHCTVAQLRYLLNEIDSIVSEEEWNY